MASPNVDINIIRVTLSRFRSILYDAQRREAVAHREVEFDKAIAFQVGSFFWYFHYEFYPSSDDEDAGEEDEPDVEFAGDTDHLLPWEGERHIRAQIENDPELKTMLWDIKGHDRSGGDSFIGSDGGADVPDPVEGSREREDDRMKAPKGFKMRSLMGIETAARQGDKIHLSDKKDLHQQLRQQNIDALDWDCKVVTDIPTMAKLCNRSLKPMAAYLSGKIKIHGDRKVFASVGGVLKKAFNKQQSGIKKAGSTGAAAAAAAVSAAATASSMEEDDDELTNTKCSIVVRVVGAAKIHASTPAVGHDNDKRSTNGKQAQRESGAAQFDTALLRVEGGGVKGNAGVVYYRIEIQNRITGERWQVNRRFSEFIKLREDLKTDATHTAAYAAYYASLAAAEESSTGAAAAAAGNSSHSRRKTAIRVPVPKISSSRVSFQSEPSQIKERTNSLDVFLRRVVAQIGDGNPVLNAFLGNDPRGRLAQQSSLLVDAGRRRQQDATFSLHSRSSYSVVGNNSTNNTNKNLLKAFSDTNHSCLLENEFSINSLNLDRSRGSDTVSETRFAALMDAYRSKTCVTPTRASYNALTEAACVAQRHYFEAVEAIALHCKERAVGWNADSMHQNSFLIRQLSAIQKQIATLSDMQYHYTKSSVRGGGAIIGGISHILGALKSILTGFGGESSEGLGGSAGSSDPSTSLSAVSARDRSVVVIAFRTLFHAGIFLLCLCSILYLSPFLTIRMPPQPDIALNNSGLAQHFVNFSANINNTMFDCGMGGNHSAGRIAAPGIRETAPFTNIAGETRATTATTTGILESEFHILTACAVVILFVSLSLLQSVHRAIAFFCLAVLLCDMRHGELLRDMQLLTTPLALPPLFRPLAAQLISTSSSSSLQPPLSADSIVASSPSSATEVPESILSQPFFFSYEQQSRLYQQHPLQQHPLPRPLLPDEQIHTLPAEVLALSQRGPPDQSLQAEPKAQQSKEREHTTLVLPEVQQVDKYAEIEAVSMRVSNRSAEVEAVNRSVNHSQMFKNSPETGQNCTFSAECSQDAQYETPRQQHLADQQEEDKRSVWDILLIIFTKIGWLLISSVGRAIYRLDYLVISHLKKSPFAWVSYVFFALPICYLLRRTETYRRMLHIYFIGFFLISFYTTVHIFLSYLLRLKDAQKDRVYDLIDPVLAPYVAYNIGHLRSIFLKFAQYIGGRSDMVSEHWGRALSSLHDACPPSPRAHVERSVRAAIALSVQRQRECDLLKSKNNNSNNNNSNNNSNNNKNNNNINNNSNSAPKERNLSAAGGDLGVDGDNIAEVGVEDVFETFDWVPMASASIGQVHAATIRLSNIRKLFPDAETNAWDSTSRGAVQRKQNRYESILERVLSQFLSAEERRSLHAQTGRQGQEYERDYNPAAAATADSSRGASIYTPLNTSPQSSSFIPTHLLMTTANTTAAAAAAAAVERESIGSKERIGGRNTEKSAGKTSKLAMKRQNQRQQRNRNRRFSPSSASSVSSRSLFDCSRTMPEFSAYRPSDAATIDLLLRTNASHRSGSITGDASDEVGERGGGGGGGGGEAEDLLPVVVKVQHENIAEIMISDQKIMIFLVGIAAAIDEKWQLMLGLLKSWQATMQDELDFNTEAHNLSEMSSIIAEAPVDAAVPQPVRALTHRSVLVMTRLFGYKLTDPLALTLHGVDRSCLISRVAHCCSWQLLVAGTFNADPHPGNLLFCLRPPTKIRHNSSENSSQVGSLSGDIVPGLLDFGMTVRLPGRRRRAYCKLVLALFEGDFARAARALRSVGYRNTQSDRAPERDAEFFEYLFRDAGDKRSAKREQAAFSDKRKAQKEADTASGNGAQEKGGRAILSAPDDLLFLFRVIGLLRGMTAELGCECPIMEILALHATVGLQVPCSTTTTIGAGDRERRRRESEREISSGSDSDSDSEDHP